MLHRTEAQVRRDGPQAASLIEGFEGIAHVIADAAHDAGCLRDVIEDDLEAEAHIKANRPRSTKPPIDPGLYAEHHMMENFFQQIRRFRRFALRCMNALTSFMGFVFLASALYWLR